MAAPFKDLVIDANDHHSLADWWCAAMGYVRRDELEPPDDGGCGRMKGNGEVGGGPCRLPIRPAQVR